MKCRPAKWILWAPLAALPFLAAWWLNTGSLESSLGESAGASLKSAGADWAKVEMDGRDALLSGDAPGRNPIDQAVEAVADVYGIRRVDASAVQVKLAEPTIDTVITNNNRPEVRGTWPEGNAKSLALILPERRYELGTDKELASDGKGNWVWFPAEPLKDGAYNIGLEVSDGAGAVTRVEKPEAVTVDTVPPPAATFEPVAGEASPQNISGAWAEGEASSLSLSLAGKTHVLGSDQTLTSAGGQWTLALAEPLAAGIYDLVIEVGDRAGNLTRSTIERAIVIAKALSPAALTVDKYAGNDRTPELSGTFDEAASTSLTVAIGGRTYVLGTDASLTSDGQGHWKLAISEPLKDGIYDVVVTATDALGNSAKDQTVAEVEIDATGPAAPTINPATALPLTGTFDPADTKILRATLAGRTYMLGADAALTAEGTNWTLAPEAELAPGAYDIVVEAVDSFGNVTADASKDELVIAEAVTEEPELVSPTVDPVESLAARPTLTGGWQQDVAAGLSVGVGDKTFVFGTDAELTSADGRWSLAIPSPLADGVYDVVAEVTGKDGTKKRDETRDELIVDAAGPAAPTVALYAGEESPPAIRGTWAEGDAVSLAVTFNGKTARNGHDAALSTDGKGNWTLALSETLPPGSYDVAVTTADKRGRIASDQTKNEILIKEGPVVVALVAPTVDPQEALVDRPTVTGSWTEEAATGLTVSLAGQSFAYGKAVELTSSEGKWSLAFPSPLADGVYDVSVEVTGKDGSIVRDTTKDELVVDAVGPAQPTVDPYTGDASPRMIKGTWAEGDAITLSIALNRRTIALGRDDALTTDGKGGWSLAIDEELPPGTYDVLVMTADKQGRIATDATENEIVVLPRKTEPVLQAPTVDRLESLVARPTVTGMWLQDIVDGLSVTLAGRTYVFGTDAELSSAAGRWSLAVPAPLKDGVYDVVAEVTGKGGEKKQDETADELVVDAEGPASPTVTLYSGTESPSSIEGTWAEGDAISLTVSLDGKSAELGKDPALSSDGQGHWSLAVSGVLAPGSYDVAVVTADKHGRIASDQTRFEILVKDRDEPPPPPPADCDMEFMKTLITRPIHFETDKSAVTPEAAVIIKDLAAIAGFCKDKRLEVSGHTDSVGSDAYNLALSERRALAVVNALTAFGVERGRLDAKGYGESTPLASNETPEGRFVNRRIEIKTIK